MVSFFTAGSWEKDTIFVAARNFFQPSLFCEGFSKSKMIIFLQFSVVKNVKIRFKHFLIWEKKLLRLTKGGFFPESAIGFSNL